jgi:hypothetical protein
MGEPDRARGMRRAVLAALLVATAVLAGCGGSGGGTCAAGSGDGTLMIVVSGHDPAAITIEGVAGTQTGSTMVTAAVGPHEITAAPVTSPQSGITSQVYAATVTPEIACVRMGATTVVNVQYALVPTSGKLWAGVSNAPRDFTMFGFEPAAVAAGGMTAADVSANTGGSDGFTFDRAGNMWVLGGTTADPPVARYPAAMFASDGDKLPDVIIDSPSFGASVPGPKVLAFDAAGNLGVAAHDDDAVVRIDAAHLATPGTGSDLAITAQSSPPVIGTLPPPISLAFDAAGRLWVNYDGTIASITTAEQAGTGSKTITPAVQITTDVSTLPVGIAFDQDGGLWLAHEVNKFARFDATQLGASGAVAPATIITSTDVGSAGWFAMYPAPPFTPLYHKVP